MQISPANQLLRASIVFTAAPCTHETNIYFPERLPSTGRLFSFLKTVRQDTCFGTVKPQSPGGKDKSGGKRSWGEKDDKGMGLSLSEEKRKVMTSLKTHC